MFELVNHHLWFELGEGRVYVKWGHFPSTDGKLDPSTIVFTYPEDAIIGIDKDSSAKKALFMEFKNSKAIAIDYDRGEYALTESNKWVKVGKPETFGERVKERFRIVGRGKLYLDLVELNLNGLDLRLLNKPSLCNDVKVSVVFDNKALVNQEVKVHYPDRIEILKTDEKGVVNVKATSKIFVISTSLTKNGIRNTTTLTVII